MKDQTRKISILIPIFNRLEITKSGLKSLFAALQNYEAWNSAFSHYDIIVIDDGSTDGSSEWISANYPQIHILRGDGNLWWSGGINLGARYAAETLHSDCVLLWNNDIIPANDYFIELDKLIHASDDAILGSYIYDHESGRIWSKGGYFNIVTGRRTMLPEKIRQNNYVYNWLPGMGTLVPLSVVARIGYWDSETFPQYHGDFDFTIRASKQGIGIKCSEKLKLYNKTQYSSIKGTSWKSFLKSFFVTGSRYNIKKDILMYKRHTISFLWIFSFLKKYTIYFGETFLPKAVIKNSLKKGNLS
jgi:GT2 family glycosyltransferase